MERYLGSRWPVALNEREFEIARLALGDAAEPYASKVERALLRMRATMIPCKCGMLGTWSQDPRRPDDVGLCTECAEKAHQEKKKQARLATRRERVCRAIGIPDRDGLWNNPDWLDINNYGQRTNRKGVRVTELLASRTRIRSIAVTGPPGTGKTTFAAELAVFNWREGRNSIAWLRDSDLGWMTRSFNQGDRLPLESELVVIDDLGTRHLDAVINAFDQANGLWVFTTNHPVTIAKAERLNIAPSESIEGSSQRGRALSDRLLSGLVIESPEVSMRSAQ